MINIRVLYILLFVTIGFINCSEKADKTNTPNLEPVKNVVLLTVYQISPDYYAELGYDKESDTLLCAMVNGTETKSVFNLPKGKCQTKVVINDYNFDGYNDFAIVTGTDDNIQYYTNLFDPVTEWFMPFKTFSNLEVDKANKQLISNEVIVPGNVVATIYQVDGFSTVMQKSITEKFTYNTYTIDNGQIGTLHTIQHTGNEKLLLDSDGNTARYVTQGKRLYLYNSPRNAGKTSMYLVTGDEMELIDIAEGFFKIKFVNPKYGNIIKWIKYKNGEL